MDLELNYLNFKNEISQIKRDGIDEFLSWLDTTDFKTAPASTVYHSCDEGGLCKHSLNVYNNLKKLNEDFNLGYSDDSVRVVSLLHDLSKADFYEKYFKNEKLYSNNGSKHDDNGNFDWVSVLSYKIKDPTQRMLAADHGTNSYILASKYIPMTDEEMISIINHHAGMDNNNANRDMNSILKKYKLASALHIADMTACYLDE